jgi:hypothetical protein
MRGREDRFGCYGCADRPLIAAPVAGYRAHRLPLMRRSRRGRGIPPELEFLVSLADLDESQTVVEPAGIWVVFLDIKVERDACRRGLCLEVLDDGGAYAVALEPGRS